jgi:Domain of unknown function (DUF1843)
MSEQSHGHPIYLYGVALQEAARSGDVSRMRELEQQAEQHIKEVSSALEELRSAIKRHNG